MHFNAWNYRTRFELNVNGFCCCYGNLFTNDCAHVWYQWLRMFDYYGIKRKTAVAIILLWSRKAAIKYSYILFILNWISLSNFPRNQVFQRHIYRLFQKIKKISIYTLSVLGVLSNLIGSLSLANEHYSPPTEWIMRKPNKNKMAGVNAWIERSIKSTFNGFLLKMLLRSLLNLGE